MSREEKAARLLTTGRVLLLDVGPWRVLAQVAGDTDAYRVSYEAGSWSCSCPGGRFGSCSHLAAVRLVADPIRAFHRA